MDLGQKLLLWSFHNYIILELSIYYVLQDRLVYVVLYLFEFFQSLSKGLVKDIVFSILYANHLEVDVGSLIYAFVVKILSTETVDKVMD
ncbi:MAG: hypothetical protein VW418_04885, partial [Gammaproteobacteria bacterium]